MPKFSASDPRYNDLSYNEAKRQATRDNMLYNQIICTENDNKKLRSGVLRFSTSLAGMEKKYEFF